MHSSVGFAACFPGREALCEARLPAGNMCKGTNGALLLQQFLFIFHTAGENPAGFVLKILIIRK